MRLIWAFLVFTAAPAAADFDADAYPAYETCALCHGLFGQSRLAKFPHLAGQKPDYLRAQIEAFLAGVRSNDGGQMAAIVTELKPEDIPLVVAWFSEQEPPEPEKSALNAAGQALTEAGGCLTCHQNNEAAPYLSAQHAGYLAKQMEDFREGRRTHSDVASMHKTLFERDDAGLADIAGYLSSLERPE